MKKGLKRPRGEYHWRDSHTMYFKVSRFPESVVDRDTFFHFSDSPFSVGRGLEYAATPVLGATIGEKPHKELVAYSSEMWRRHCALPAERRRGLSVAPKRGRAVVFYSHRLDGEGRVWAQDLRAHHGGCDIASGEKVMLNVWFLVPSPGPMAAPLRTLPLGQPPWYHKEPASQINATMMELEGWLLHGNDPPKEGWDTDLPWETRPAMGNDTWLER
eukprot:gene19246-55497_t